MGILGADALQYCDPAGALVRAGCARSRWLLFIIAIVVNIGMWLERYVIIVVSLHRDFLPSSWGMYAGTRWDWATFIGTIGLFLNADLYLYPCPAHDLDL